MGFLSPLLLFLGAAAAVPLILHLLRRERDRRIAFPALRYLRRTTKEHAREIRLRQLVLLFVRLSLVILLVLAAARLVVPLPGGEHEPTALVLVLDNSLSSGVVEDDRRHLDRMKEIALATLERASDRDVVWVLRAGEPWALAEPLSPGAAREYVARTEVSHGASALDRALQRGVELLRGAERPARELHVLSDFQRTALGRPLETDLPQGTRVLALEPATDRPENRFLADLLVGDGLNPVAGQRVRVTARVRTSSRAEAAGVPVRLVVEGDVRGVTDSEADGSVSFPIGPFRPGWVAGFLEMDPDALADDDRLHFAFRVREPPTVELRGEDLFFLDEALEVLEDSERIRRNGEAEPDLLILAGGAGDATPPSRAPVFLLPPADPTRLPAFNRTLASHGVPWRFELIPDEGGSSVAEARIPVGLEGLRVHRRYRIEAEDGAAAGEVLAELSDGSPWIVSGRTVDRRWILKGSPLSEAASDLPVRAPLIPFLEWVTGAWVGDGTSAPLRAGEPLQAPVGSTRVRRPDGTEVELDGTLRFAETRTAGTHAVLAGDSILRLVAVNPSPAESILEPLTPDEVAERLGPDTRLLGDPAAWSRTAFSTRSGREPWRFLLVAALLLLVAEGRLAAAGSADRAGDTRGNKLD